MSDGNCWLPLQVSGPRGVACVVTDTQRAILFDLIEDEEEEGEDADDDEEGSGEGGIPDAGMDETTD